MTVRDPAAMSEPGWKVSSYCSAGACVGVGTEGDDVLVVDTKDGAGAGHLRFTPDEWEAFVAGVKDGEFDVARLRWRGSHHG